MSSPSSPKTSKRIVLVKAEAKHPGGLEKTAEQIGRAFQARGHEITWLKPSIPTWLPSFVRLEQFDRFVQSWVKNHPADIVFGFDRIRKQTHLRAGNGVHAAYLETRGFWKQAVCKINPLHRKILSIEKEAFESPGLQKLFVNSHLVKHQILQRFSVDANKIHVIHNGVAWAEKQRDFDTWPKVKKTDHYQLLFVGHGFQRKGLDLLLAALKIFCPKNVHLSVIGHDKHIERYRAQNPSVTFYGPQNNIEPFYQLADALVIPSLYDPFANVTVEALAMGLHVITSKQNGGHEVLTPETGFITELSVDGLVHALQDAFSRPKTLESALRARNSVRHLELANQMHQLVEACGG